MNISDIAPGLTRVQLTVEADPHDDMGGLAVSIDQGGLVAVAWDDCPRVMMWHTADELCREGDRPEREPRERTYDEMLWDACAPGGPRNPIVKEH